MQIISKKFLKEFGQIHPEAAGPLQAWHRIVAAIHFNRQKLYIRDILTHEQYDHWRP